MRSIMPSQWLLLLSRLLVITVLVLILANTFWKGKESDISTRYLVDTVYKETKLLKALQDSVSGEDQLVWLAKGFPVVEEDVQSHATDYWKLLADPPGNAEKTVVISPLLQKNFQGERCLFPLEYVWMKPPVTPLNEELISYQIGDQYFEVKSQFDEWKTTHALEKTDQAEPLEVSYFIRVDEPYQVQGEIFTAAISAINSHSPISVTKVENEVDADWTIWLSDQTTPIKEKIVFVNTQAIMDWSKVTSNVFQISSDLSKELAIKLNLPEKLLGAFSNEWMDTESLDRRSIDTNVFSYDLNTGKEEFDALESSVNFLWIVLLLLVIVERWLAFKSEKA